MTFLTVSLIWSFALFPLNRALEVAADSRCAPLCVNEAGSNVSDIYSSGTYFSELACNDWELSGPNSTGVGKKWVDCLNCTSTSTQHDSEANDVYWFLFNLKYTIYYCVYSYHNENQTAASRACSDKCSGSDDGMHLALTDQPYLTRTSRQYLYCDENNSSFTHNVDACTECLRNVPSSRGLVRYLEVLNEACDQKPKINGSTPVQMKTPLFEGVTDVPSSASSTATPSPGSATPSSPLPSAANTTSGSNMKLGLGLGLGLGIPLILLLAGAVWLYLRQRSIHRKELDNVRHQSEYYRTVDSALPIQEMTQGRVAELGVPGYGTPEMSADGAQRHEKDSKIISPKSHNQHH